jgi:glycyl-tRNA synthetase beta chain
MHQFVRPVHGLVMLHGERVVPGEVLGLNSGNTSRSATASLPATDRAIFRRRIRREAGAEGKVIVSFAESRDHRRQLDAKADELGATINLLDGLLDEVTALVEWPVVYVGEFESEYLEVPQECLILTMQQNQKYFPLLDGGCGKLLNRFLIVSNMQVDDPTTSSAATPASFVRALPMPASSSTRIARTALPRVRSSWAPWSITTSSARSATAPSASGALPHFVAGKLGADANLAARAACCAKVDLLTDMVGEFPELQGIMGRYYALHEGAKPDVADADGSPLSPRFAGDVLPEATSPAPPRWPTSSTRWSASSASARCRPATRTPSACAAPRSACCAS